jgi:hypothetical protein
MKPSQFFDIMLSTNLEFWSTRQKQRIPHCHLGRKSMYFHMNFEPY